MIPYRKPGEPLPPSPNIDEKILARHWTVVGGRVLCALAAYTVLVSWVTDRTFNRPSTLADRIATTIVCTLVVLFVIVAALLHRRRVRAAMAALEDQDAIMRPRIATRRNRARKSPAQR